MKVGEPDTGCLKSRSAVSRWPGLVIDGQVMARGTVPETNQIIEWLQA